MTIIRKFFLFLLLLGVALVGFRLGMRFVMPAPRQIETSRMEKCLQFYRDYRQNNDQERLALDLGKIGLTPKHFQEIIDRFIYYRSRKSSMDQAMQLLRAFRDGYNIEVTGVVSISGLASEPFRLDAEILAVFEGRPELIQEAFEG